jgi:hypothetical protein
MEGVLAGEAIVLLYPKASQAVWMAFLAIVCPNKKVVLENEGFVWTLAF